MGAIYSLTVVDSASYIWPNQAITIAIASFESYVNDLGFSKISSFRILSRSKTSGIALSIACCGTLS